MKYLSLKISTTGLDRMKDELLRVVLIEFEVNDELKPYQVKITNTHDIFIKPNVDFEVSQEWNSFTKETVLEKGHPFTKKTADAIAKYIEGNNITGFGVDNFDLCFLYEYYKRNGFNLDLSKTLTFDTMQMDIKLYPRNFEGIFKRYTGRVIDPEFTKDAYQVAVSNMDIFAVEFIQCREQQFLKDIGLPVLSPEHFIEEKGDKVVFCNGKYQYKDVAEICRQDPHYIKWVFSVATEPTKKNIEEYYYKKFPKMVKNEE